MKFTDIRTLTHVLKEYGLQAGAPTPVGQQSTGAVAKATAAPVKAPKQDLGSPSVTQGLDIPKIGEPETGVDAPQPTLMKAKDFEDGAEYLDDKGEVAGKVVSKVGKGPAIKKLIVQNPKGEYTLIDPDEELTVAPITEAKAGKYSKQVHKNALRKASKSKNSISSVKQKIKKLARKVQMQEQGAEQLFELNFNTREVIESALDSPIKCGFEAETVWEGLSNGDSQDVDDMYWPEIEDRIGDEYGRSYLDDIAEAYRNWIMEEKMYEYESDLIQDLVNERKEDEAYIEEFIDSNGGPTEGAIEQYKDDFKLNNPEEYENRIEDGYEYINWVREYVEENMEDELIEWLEQDIRDNGEVFDAALEAAEEDLGYGEWIDDQYNGYWSRMLEEYDIYLDASAGGLEEVGDELRGWASNNSQSDHIEVGEYHSGGINNDYWRVEDDSSIEGDGAGAEIISPVYQTPRAMLEEMKSLFEDLSKRSVETNSSTGLHVTMSLDPTQTGMSASAEVNKVKLAVLLGDKYLASTFGREGNSYAKSQYNRLEKKAAELKADPTNTATIKAIEEILEAGISSDKFSSINFKNQSDNQSGYNLIEFRIGGGHDYHTDMSKIVKSVVRYAETLRAGYTDEHQKDYVKALFKLINNVGRISTGLEDRVKDRYSKLNHPVVEVLKGFFSKDNYMESVGQLARAFKYLDEYKEFSQPDADEKWKQRVADFEKQTGEKMDLGEAPTPREAVVGMMKPSEKSPSVQAPKYLSEAQELFAISIAQAGYDLNQNLNRATVNAKAIGVLRKTLPEFELTYEQLSDKINKKYKQVEFTADRSDDTQTQFSRIKNGVDRLFKKEIIQSPNWLTDLQVEKIISGIWNAINSEEDAVNDSELKNLIVQSSGNTTDSDVQIVFNSKDNDTYVKLRRTISGGRGDWFNVGQSIQSKDYDALLKKLKTYPVWDKPVSKSHDARAPRADTYTNAATSQLLTKLGNRINALDKLSGSDPETYIKSIKQLVTSTEKLLAATNTGDTDNLFNMYSRTHSRIEEIIAKLQASNFVRSPFDSTPGMQIFDHVKDYLESAFDIYYIRIKKQELTDAEREEIKPRTDAIKTWLSDVDKIATKMGFDSQSGAIDNKLQQHTAGTKHQRTTHGDAPATVSMYSFGGSLYATRNFYENINTQIKAIDNTAGYMPAHIFYKNFTFSRSIHISDSGEVFLVPHAYYFAAMAANEIYNAPEDKHPAWRQQSARHILQKWHDIYGIPYDRFVRDVETISKYDLENLRIEIKDAGDGREGAGANKYDPLLPRDQINAPNGEPFEPESAAVWRMNNPEKANDPEAERATSVGVDDPFAKARASYPAFDNMMHQGMPNFMQSGKPVNDLVGFLNNSGNTSAMKNAVLAAIRINKDGAGVPLTSFDQALQLGVNRMGSNESVFNKFDKLPLQRQLALLESIDGKKLNKVYESFAANTTHLAPPPKKKKTESETLNPPSITVGDEVKVGKFKNSKATVKGFTKDEHGQPVLKTDKGDKPLYKPRVSKLEPKKDTVKEAGVPNLNKIRILNKILADHFPVSDLKKQMLAYEAIPIPQMLSDFRGLRAGSGDDACARGVVRHYIQALSKEEQKHINLKEWSKSKVRALVESKGIMGRVMGDTFLKGDDKLEFQQVDLYPLEEMQFENAESRDVYIQQLEQENNIQIEWTNTPNNGSLAFGLATLTDPMLDDKITYWGRYFKQKTADMMGKWGNSQVPIGWKLQTAGAMKLDIGIDPQHLIKTDDPFNGVIEVIQAVKTNSAGTELSDSLVAALETIHTQQHPEFTGQISNLPALRDYFGEIMGPVALMSEMVGGQADAARDDLLSGQPWASCSIFWPMAMNAPLVDSYFTAPDGTRVGISSKGGKGAKASVKNIYDAIAKAPDEMKAQYQPTVNIVNIVQSNSAKDGPFRLAELYQQLPQGLEQEVNGYIKEGKKDYAGISPAATELFNYGTPRQDVPGFNVGYALLALLAKKVTRVINESGPEFGQGCVAFLNQSSIVQLYCKMGKNGQDARVTGWEAVYPPNFQGTVEIDGSKNYYSSRIGGKFAFGFK